jgi:FeS assembly SUF system regulator
MLTLTRKTDYALVAMAALAQQATEDKPLSAARIAKEFGLPAQVLMKVLKNLQQAGLIASSRGAHGGYFLTQDPQWITLGSVIEAIEGSVRLTPCCTEGEPSTCLACAAMPNCQVRDRMRQLNERVNTLFAQVTLGDLLAPDFDATLSQVSLHASSNRTQTLQARAQ